MEVVHLFQNNHKTDQLRIFFQLPSHFLMAFWVLFISVFVLLEISLGSTKLAGDLSLSSVKSRFD